MGVRQHAWIFRVGVAGRNESVTNSLFANQSRADHFPQDIPVLIGSSSECFGDSS